jgi:pimeloyl-ACP methyl ester carboxylesterase
MTTAFAHTVTAPGLEAQPELREGFAEVGDVRLHYVEAGNGPLVVLLHGFPEFWFGWRLQIAALAAAGYRVVAPDMRGYNLSSRPGGISKYSAADVADDIDGLIHELGAESAMVVGHDWGGTIAWTLAMNHPEDVDRLVILDAAHPRKLQKGLFNPRQLLRSWYFFFFTLPWLPERIVRAKNFRFFRRFLRDARPAHTPEEMDRYVEAWSQPGALTGMIDYYRNSVLTPPWKAWSAIRTVTAPTLVIWGGRDRFLGPKLAEPEHHDVPNLDRVVRLPNASHWAHHDEADRVNELLVDFFSPVAKA